jgi:hypothetical protein
LIFSSQYGLLTALMGYIRIVFFDSEKYTQQCADEINNQLHKHSYAALTKQEIKRIKSYIIQSCITNYWFATLHDINITPKEKALSHWLGAVTPFSDDMTDGNHSGVEYDRIRFLVQWLTKKLKDYSTPAFDEEVELILKIQEQSKMQRTQELNFQLIENITYLKGGHATLLYRKILNHPVSNAEKNYILQLGKTLQLINDVFDVYKDTQERITTIPNRFLVPSDFEKYLLSEIQKTKELFFQLIIERDNLKKVWMQYAIIFSRGLSCTRQLRRLHDDHGHFNIQQFNRKQLIHDMEKPRNFLRSLYIALYL